MIKWFKKNQSTPDETQDNTQLAADDNTRPAFESDLLEPPTKGDSILSRMRRALSKTRHQLGEGLTRLLHGKKEIDAELLEELETLLLSADLGLETTETLLKKLTENLARKDLSDGHALHEALVQELEALLQTPAKLAEKTQDNTPFVLLMVGVNGAGKTTTIGKLAKHFQQQGKKVMLAAGDTFRAAAVEQLQIWGQRNQIPVIAQQTGADSASVIFDALTAAKARHIDILIADTAGRLHTQNNLMEELKKIKRVLQELDPKAPHDIMLVLDASIGQNALVQAKLFHEALGLTGITMTKLDGTAKGGIVFAIAHHLGIPLRYIGIGEQIDDLRPFEAAQFVSALFHDDLL